MVQRRPRVLGECSRPSQLKLKIAWRMTGSVPYHSAIPSGLNDGLVKAHSHQLWRFNARRMFLERLDRYINPTLNWPENLSTDRRRHS
jgi:hypothetical protein